MAANHHQPESLEGELREILAAFEFRAGSDADGLVVVAFPRRTRCLLLAPEEALRFGQFVIDRAREVLEARGRRGKGA